MVPLPARSVLISHILVSNKPGLSYEKFQLFLRNRAYLKSKPKSLNQPTDPKILKRKLYSVQYTGELQIIQQIFD